MLDRMRVAGLPSPAVELVGRVLRNESRAEAGDGQSSQATFSSCLQGVDFAWNAPEGSSLTEVEGRYSYSYDAPGSSAKDVFLSVTDADQSPNLQLQTEVPPDGGQTILTIANPGPDNSSAVVRIPLGEIEYNMATFPRTDVENVQIYPDKGEILVKHSHGQQNRYMLRNGVLMEDEGSVHRLIPAII